ncbi:MAG: phosphoenolpyruvate--protein phosphotransferase [Candidatus Omnitrophica bacterium]|nr:phosphoenolpyruvate--protein phosphotransferase [Candidatus Omnitrophota bacterium]
MKTIKGYSAASGIATGPVCLYLEENSKNIPNYNIKAEDVPEETGRVVRAFNDAASDMEKSIESAKIKFNDETSFIFNAHLAILSDVELIRQIIEQIEKKKINAEQAIENIFTSYTSKYSSLEGHFNELVHDFEDVKLQVLGVLISKKILKTCPQHVNTKAIVITKRLTPSLILQLERDYVLGFIASEGGLTSHATILARAFGVPIIFSEDILKCVDCGTDLIMDAGLRKIIINADAKTKKYYDKKIAAIKKKKFVCEIQKDLSPRTKTGKKIKLKVNLSTPDELSLSKDFMDDGIGLLRTEFLFMDRNTQPSEDEQYKMYSKILNERKGSTVTMRILDIGPDKLPQYLEKNLFHSKDFVPRGAGAAEAFPEIYLTQFKALLRSNTHSNLRILFPMVCDLGDIKAYRNIFNEAQKKLKEEKVIFSNKKIDIGAMLETPSSILMSDEILKNVDFANVGSNDLFQYTLASSRGDSNVERRYHLLHPSILKLMEIAVKNARKYSKELCLCGEIASFEEFYPLLLKIGIKSFSVSVSKFEDIKCELLHLHDDHPASSLKQYYDLKTPSQRDKFFEKFM